jgi:glycosyltransferase involved in cell wall biosynthesis/spore maturation protein CgeB
MNRLVEPIIFADSAPVDGSPAPYPKAGGKSARHKSRKEGSRPQTTEKSALLQGLDIQQLLHSTGSTGKAQQGSEVQELHAKLAALRSQLEQLQQAAAQENEKNSQALERSEREQQVMLLDLLTLRQQIAAARETSDSAEQQLAQLQENLSLTRTRLDEASLKYRGATSQVATLKQALAFEARAQADIQALVQSLRFEATAAATALEQEQARFAMMAKAMQQINEEERPAHQAQMDALLSTTTQLTQALFAAQQEHEQAQSELKSITLRHEQLTSEHTQAIRQAAISADHTAALSAELDAVRAKLATVLADLGKARISAENSQIALQSRHSDVARLGSDVETLNALDRARQLEFDQLKTNSLRNRVALNEARAQLEQSRLQLQTAQLQNMKLRNTLAYQLGHTLIFGFKSWSGMKTLPGKLWQVRKEAKLRRLEKSGRENLCVPDAGDMQPALASDLSVRAHLARRPVPLLKLNITSQGMAATLKGLRVAAVMDEFTYGCFQKECNLLQLSPIHWDRELAAFKPELLFIESAWRGKDGLWGNKIGHRSSELEGIINCCHQLKVPTAFWNKEDPVHFETFLSTAKLFDHVFTTDIDCIHRYKAALGHERVYLLPFACQPAVHNPVEIYERKDAFSFAGAYYVRYPDRTRDLGNFVTTLPDFRPVEIYDRNHGKTDPNYQFPPEYQPFIVGSLPFEEIDKAYKGYRYAINLNSIKQSQTMFARRVYELLGSNTLTTSNYSRGLRLMFGDLVFTSDSGIEQMRRLKERCSDDSSAAKLRLAGLRKVMSEHTYQDRLAYMVSRVRGESVPSLLPRVIVLACAKNDAQVEAIAASFSSQTYQDRQLVLVLPAGFSPQVLPFGVKARQIAVPDAQALTVAALGNNEDWLAVMVSDDYYGPNYLLDLALATRYAAAPVVGKSAHYVWSTAIGLRLAQPELAYRRSSAVPARCGAALLETLQMNLREFVAGLYTATLDHENALAIDPFNYCRNSSAGGFNDALIRTISDLNGLNIGITMAELGRRAEAIAPASQLEDSQPQINGTALAALFTKAPTDSRVRMTLIDGALQLDSNLSDGKHEYWYVQQLQSLESLGAVNGKLRFYGDLSPGLNVQLVLKFFDASDVNIASPIKPCNRNVEFDIPAGANRVRMGLRIYAGGSAQLRTLLLGHRTLEPGDLIGRGEHLVLTNHYPSHDDLYRNGFVHKRVLAYTRKGVPVDVFRLRSDEALSYHEFEDIDCITGSADALSQMLASGRYRSVLVHFLDEAMWKVLKHFIDRIKLVVWVHGAEIQPYHRRAFLYKTEAERSTARQRSEARMAFWSSVLQPMPANLQMVFVSNQFAEEVMEDLGFRLPDHAYQVIHNPIDTDLFQYRVKHPDLRKKILSIRPYSSTVYANDLSVKAILELSTKECFKDLEFRLIGDGLLFDETVEPLRKFNNICIEKRFLTQGDIALLHQQYGIFLCPSRMDTQGVSRDEAMSSGLVPVTNRAGAIEEFVDISCGVLAPAEDHLALADGIEKLANDPDLFLRMSEAASRRVASQSAAGLVIQAELNWIDKDLPGLPGYLAVSPNIDDSSYGHGQI